MLTFYIQAIVRYLQMGIAPTFAHFPFASSILAGYISIFYSDNSNTLTSIKEYDRVKTVLINRILTLKLESTSTKRKHDLYNVQQKLGVMERIRNDENRTIVSRLLGVSASTLYEN